jgi:hypothetical protein
MASSEDTANGRLMRVVGTQQLPRCCECKGISSKVGINSHAYNDFPGYLGAAHFP